MTHEHDETHLGPAFRAAISTVPNSGQLDPETVRTTHTQRRRRRRATTIAAAVGVLATIVLAITLTHSSMDLVAAPPEASPSAELDGRMTLEPASTSPGALITLRFPTQMQRGIAFSLESQAGQGAPWRIEYYLIASLRGSKPYWFRPGDPDSGWVDIGIGGPGGEQVQIPEVAEPGTYRLCTANSASQACALLTVN